MLGLPHWTDLRAIRRLRQHLFGDLSWAVPTATSNIDQRTQQPSSPTTGSLLCFRSSPRNDGARLRARQQSVTSRRHRRYCGRSNSGDWQRGSRRNWRTYRQFARNRHRRCRRCLRAQPEHLLRYRAPSTTYGKFLSMSDTTSSFGESTDSSDFSSSQLGKLELLFSRVSLVTPKSASSASR